MRSMGLVGSLHMSSRDGNVRVYGSNFGHSNIKLWSFQYEILN